MRNVWSSSSCKLFRREWSLMSQEMSEASELSVDRKGGIVTVTLRTDNLLDIEEVNRISLQIRNLLEDGELKIILDLGQIQYAGSAALGMLLSLDQELKSKGGKLVLTNVGKIETLLKISRTRSVVTIAADPASAEKIM